MDEKRQGERQYICKTPWEHISTKPPVEAVEE